MKRLCTPARHDTTSELTVGNGSPGMPVIVHAMSGGLVRNQGGTVEYIIYLCIPPLIMSGAGVFFIAKRPPIKRRTPYV